MSTYDIASANLDYLQSRVDKLNRRAGKLGVGCITLTLTGRGWTVPAKLNAATGAVTRRAYERVEFELAGGIVKLAGWHFLGTIEHTPAGNILRSVPGEEMPEDYRLVATACDHCGKQRTRKDTYLVQHDDGSVKQLGRACTADYLGNVDPSKWARFLEQIDGALADASDDDDMDAEFDGWGGRSGYLGSALRVVAAAVADVRMHHGLFVPSNQAGSTRSTVELFLWGRLEDKARKALLRTGYSITDDDTKRANELLDWIAGQTDAGYIANLRIAVAGGFVTRRNMGLVCSITAAYSNAQRSAQERAERAVAKAYRDAKWAAEREQERADSTPAPEGRVEMTGTVLRITRQESEEWGTIYKLTVKSDDGWRMWVTQPASLQGGISEGDRVAMRVTLTPSDDDETFAFGKRPSNARLLKGETA